MCWPLRSMAPCVETSDGGAISAVLSVEEGLVLGVSDSARAIAGIANRQADSREVVKQRVEGIRWSPIFEFMRSREGVSAPRVGRALLLRLIKGLFVGDAGAAFCLQFFAYLLDFAKDAQQVAAENLTAILRGVATLQQRRGDLGQVGG